MVDVRERLTNVSSMHSLIHICPLIDIQLVSSFMRVRKNFSPCKDLFTPYDMFTIYNIRFKQVEMHGCTLKVTGRV